MFIRELHHRDTRRAASIACIRRIRSLARHAGKSSGLLLFSVLREDKACADDEIFDHQTGA